MKYRIPVEERHFIQMAQAALKISLRKIFKYEELADKASKYEELLKKNNKRRTLPKAHTTKPLLLQSIWLR
ncbi:unnamed protein product [Prunus armeniaca]